MNSLSFCFGPFFFLFFSCLIFFLLSKHRLCSFGLLFLFNWLKITLVSWFVNYFKFFLFFFIRCLNKVYFKHPVFLKRLIDDKRPVHNVILLILRFSNANLSQSKVFIEFVSQSKNYVNILIGLNCR